MTNPPDTQEITLCKSCRGRGTRELFTGVEHCGVRETYEDVCWLCEGWGTIPLPLDKMYEDMRADWEASKSEKPRDIVPRPSEFLLPYGTTA